MKTLIILAFFSLAICARAQTNIPDQRLAQFVPIHRVLLQAAFCQGRFRNSLQLIPQWLAIDTSKCPDDFQAAWLAFMREWQGNEKTVQAHASKVLVEETGALLLASQGIDEPLAKTIAANGLSEAKKPPVLQHTASDNLKALILKYEGQ